jgi:2-polyprenyl-3-methyl-5-hydroxy-6-metoxy-1,4-benzoquinol methylase
MNIEMYRVFFEIQKKHWWFVSKKKIITDQIKRNTKPSVRKRILDIGCGSGLMLNALEEFGETYGMDMSDEALHFSKEIFTGTVRKGTLPDVVPYDKQFFDIITALDVIEHIEKDYESLVTVHSLLSEGGKVIITVPAYMFLWSNFDNINQHKRRYTLPELKAKILSAGFRLEKISYYNSLLFPAVWLVRMLNNFLQRDGSSDVDMPPNVINFLLGLIFGFEKYILRFFSLPFGVSILAIASK